MIQPLRGKTPQIANDCFVAPSADIIGDVKIGRKCSIWYHTTLRGDVMPIVIGDETNIQDGTVIHGTFQKCGAVIGNQVTVGHSVVLHGCTIGDRVLVGMGSIIMDQAEIPSDSIVGAGSLVTENSTFPPGHLIMGRPAKAVRPLKDNERAFLTKSSQNYIDYMKWYEDKES